LGVSRRDRRLPRRLRTRHQSALSAAHKIRELEITVAELAGAVRVLNTGKTLCVRGLYNEGARYEKFDVVALGGSSFIAREDNPGQCPGPGWQLLCSAGSRGGRGPVGPRGERGEKGERAEAGLGFKFHLDQKTYTLSFIAPDGKIHALDLRPLFQQFVNDARGDW
jgi:hypothetical protein